MSLVAHKYTPGEMSDHELEATFAAREHTVDYLVKALRDQRRSGTLSSFVITAPRGAGKSTVIHMVDLRIRQDSELSDAWIPVVFPEEQFNIASLRDLLAATIQVLTKEGVSDAAEWLKKVEDEPNDEQSQQIAITGLKAITRKAGKRLVLFVENLNLLLEESLTDQMKGTLRRLLMTDPFMMLMGSSVHLFDSLKQYHEAFFNYFGQVPLNRLTPEQVFELLIRRAQFDSNERFLKEFPKQQPKIRAIVHLSGGNPRLILMLYELLSQQQVTTIVQYLRRLVDELTPLLKDEMENLPPQQRKIMHALMEKGGTAQPADLVAPTRLPLNAITTQLRRLKDAQIVEVLGGGKGRAANYTVPDKLFAIWYQMRYLSQNRRRIELFVEVLRVWFEEEERVETLKSLAHRAQSSAPDVLRECATTAEYFAASLRGTKYAQIATDVCIGHWVKTDLHEAALAYADLAQTEGFDEVTAHTELADWLNEHDDPRRALEALDQVLSTPPFRGSTHANAFRLRGVIKRKQGDIAGAVSDFTTTINLDGAPVEQVAMALLSRGLTKGQQGDMAGEINDMTSVTEMDGVHKEHFASAMVARGATKGQEGKLREAIADFGAVIELPDAPKTQYALALACRGIAKDTQGDISGAIADFSAAIQVHGLPIEQLAMALFRRGLLKRSQEDFPGALADFTTLTELKKAPAVYRARALLNRGYAHAGNGDTTMAIANYTSVVEMGTAPPEETALALINRAVAKEQQGDVAGAISDYTAVVALNGVPVEQVGTALYYRGCTKGEQGDIAGEIADYTAVVELDNAPKEQIAMALVGRGLVRARQEERTAAIADYSAAIALEGAPAEWIARALINRGAEKAKYGDTVGACLDNTAVVQLSGAPAEAVARALVNRGAIKGEQSDIADAIADFSVAITKEGAPKKLVARALFSRGFYFYQAGEYKKGIEDLVNVIELGETTDDLLIDSAQLAFTALCHNKNFDSAKSVLLKLVNTIGTLPREQVREITIRFLSGLAAFTTKKAWPVAWRTLAESQCVEAREALEFLRPVCAILEGQDAVLLEALPPEQREFVKTVLARFEEKSEGDEPKRKPETRAPKPRKRKIAKK